MIFNKWQKISIKRKEKREFERESFNDLEEDFWVKIFPIDLFDDELDWCELDWYDEAEFHQKMDGTPCIMKSILTLIQEGIENEKKY